MMFSSFSKHSLAIVGAIAAVGMTSFVGANPAQAAIINGNFSSGFSGWNTSGSTDASSGTAVLTAGAQDVASIESFLGLASGTLATIGGAPTNGSAIKQSFFANAGTVVSFDWLFQANDYLPYNDFAFYSIAPVGANLLSNVATVGDYGSSGQQSLSFTIGTTGAYTLGFGVFNALDNVNSSTLSIDNVSTGVTPVPTPALLPGLIGLGVVALRKRKAEAVEQASEV